jgi:hypothetical protein
MNQKIIKGVKSMRSFKLSFTILSSVGLLILGACSNNNQASNPSSSPAASPGSSPSETTGKLETKTDHPEASQGDQVVEFGAYHLELVPEKEDSGTHLDLYLQKGDNHEAIPNAKVTAQVQLPDGSQKKLDLKYDADGKHYTVLLPEKATGQYQVKMTADINGEKVDGRFSFNQ